MSGWTPLFSNIVDSSVWSESKDVKILWITFLAKKDKNGFVPASIPGMARAAGLTVNECQEALRVLESPDPMSSSPQHEGRRIKRVDHGWIILNHFVYRDMVSKAKLQDYNRQKQAEYRERVRMKKEALKEALKLKDHELGHNGNPTREEVAQIDDEVRCATME